MPMTEFVNGTAYESYGDHLHPVVVLIHGLGLRKSMWRSHIDLLSKSYRVLAYDLYGHGESVAPPVQPSLRLFAQQLEDLLNQLKIDHCAIVGFSLGGMINRRFAMDWANRVTSLLVLNSPHERTPDEQLKVEQRALNTQDGGPAATIETTLKRWFTPDFIVSQPAVIKQVRNWVLNNDPAIYAQCRWVLANGVRELIRPTPPICKPTLVMTSENDSGSTPAMSHSIANEIAGAKTVIVPRLQHLGLLEEPNRFTEHIISHLDASV